jgi:acetoin utilization deacetylase AcuC-like enzyme
LTVTGFRMIGEKVRKMAELCGGKEIDLIASGYNREVLPYAWLALLAGLAGWDMPTEEPGKIPALLQPDSRLPQTKRMVSEVKSYLKGYWKNL